MAGQSQGAQAQLSIGGDKMCFVSVKDETVFHHVDGTEESICGSLLHLSKSRVRPGIVVPKLHITMQATPEELNLLLPLLGFAETTDVFDFVTDFTSLTDFDVIVDRGPSVATYSNGIPDKVFVRSQKGTKPWAIEMQVFFDSIGIDDGGTFSDTAPATTAPYAFNDASLTLSGNTELFQSVLHVIDYNTVVQHNNSQFPTSIQPSDIRVYLGLDIPYTSDEVALLSTFTGEVDAVSPADEPAVAGYSGSVVYTAGGISTTWAYHNLKSPQTKLPDILRKEEIRMKLFLEAFGNGSSANPLTITNDITA